jgi:hypothetical protein
MKKRSVADPSQIKFASAVRNHAPKVAGKLPLLMPFKEGIAELRRKHASYKIIANAVSVRNAVGLHAADREGPLVCTLTRMSR